MPLIRAALILAAAVFTGCANSPTRYKTVVKSDTGDVTWYGPTQAVADARARWYADPKWRVAANIPCLGYGK